MPVSLHGTASVCFFDSSEHNYLVSSENRLEPALYELILNASQRWKNGLSLSLQGYAYWVNHYKTEELDLATLTYSKSKYIGFRVGRIKLPYGLYGDSQDIDALRPYALLPIDAYSRTFRTLGSGYDGTQLYGEAPLDERYGRLQYKLGGGLMKRSDVDATYYKDLNQMSPFLATDMKRGRVLSLDLEWETPIDGLNLLVSSEWLRNFRNIGVMKSSADLQILPNDNRDLPADFPPGLYDQMLGGQPAWSRTDLERYTVGFEYRRGIWQVAGEYHRMHSSYYGEYPQPIGSNAGSFQSDVFVLYGTVDATRKLQLGTYYSEAYGDISDRSGSKLKDVPRLANYLGDLDFSVSYHVNRWWLVKAEAHFMRGNKGLTYALNGDATTWKPDWRLFVLKTTFSF